MLLELFRKEILPFLGSSNGEVFATSLSDMPFAESVSPVWDEIGWEHSLAT